MPPLKYRVLPNHAKARLSEAEKARLIAGLRRLYATDPPAAIKRIGTQRRSRVDEAEPIDLRSRC